MFGCRSLYLQIEAVKNEALEMCGGGGGVFINAIIILKTGECHESCRHVAHLFLFCCRLVMFLIGNQTVGITQAPVSVFVLRSSMG